MSIRYIASSRLPTPWGVFDMHGFEDIENEKEHVVLTMGDVADGEPVLARIHSECLTGDALFSMRCDCGAQLRTALERIAREGSGALLYLRQEGRGIGLLNKIRDYHLQDQGADTVEANEALGFAADLRSYDLAASILADLGVRSVALMTNNPDKLAGLEKAGVRITSRVPHWGEHHEFNRDYLEVKRQKLGHKA